MKKYWVLFLFLTASLISWGVACTASHPAPTGPPPAATNTSTSTAVFSATSTSTKTSTATPPNTYTQTATPTTTATSTQTSVPSATQTSLPSETQTSVPSATQTTVDTATATGTATTTATVTTTSTYVPDYSWTFEDGSVDGFSVAYNATYDTLAPTSYTALQAIDSGMTVPGSNGVSALDLTMNSTGGNDIQAQTTYVYNNGSNGIPINFALFNASGVSMVVYVMPDAVPSGTGPTWIGGALIMRTSGSVYGGGTIGGVGSGWTNLPTTADAGWTSLSLAPTASSWSTDETFVSSIGIEINVSGGTQPASSDFIIDNLIMY